MRRAGSSPAMRTTYSPINGGETEICTDFAQIPKTSRHNVKFPVTVDYKGQKAKIYRPAKNFAFYRVCFRMAGKRKMLTFSTYAEAHAAAKQKVRDIHNGQHSAALTAKQSRDALAAFERIQEFHQATGRQITLLSGISEYCEVLTKLNGHTLNAAADGFLTTVVNVKRKDIKEAINDFLRGQEPLTKAPEGQRSQLSGKYAYNRKLQLDRFADTFPGHAVCDLTKEHVDTFFKSLEKVKATSRNHRPVGTAKSRNHYRAAVRQFLEWAVRNDYLSPVHRLNEAEAMRPERATNTASVQIYTPVEFAALLAAAKDGLKPLRPIIAIGGLAGLRTSELLRLDWSEVWRKDGNIEVTAGKAKTRQRRLVEICPALAAWLEPFRKLKSGKLWLGHEVVFQQSFVKLCKQAVIETKGKKVAITRKPNGLRKSFCSSHYELYANENLTAQQAGNSPTMIHSNYKGLVTKSDAAKWFGVLPPMIKDL